MPISFPNIPTGPNLLIPGFFVDMDPSRAGYGTNPKRALLIGQTVTVATAVPTLISTYDQAGALFGYGSQIARMVAAYRANDIFGELWVLPVADNGSGVAATGTVVFSGTTTAAGTLALYIAGQLVSIGIASGTASTAVATAVAAAITAVTTLPVTASAATSTVTLTARNKGTQGNDIDIRVNYRGAVGGETTPAGLTAVITAMASGATDPTTSGFDAILTEVEYDYVAIGWSSTTALDDFKTLMADTTGRWSWLRQVYGHVFACKRDTSANLVTLGSGRNDPHMTILGIFDSPTPAHEIAAALAADVAVSVKADAARPVQSLALAGVLAPPVASRFTRSVQNTLLGGGIALATFDSDGTVRIQRCVTTYQKNTGGQTDRSMLDVETLYTYMEVTRRLRSAVTTKFPRHKLAADGTRFGPGQPVMTPKAFKAELVAQYAAMEYDGLVEDPDGFATATFVEIDANDPNRLNVLFAPNFVNQLRVLAVLNQFRV